MENKKAVTYILGAGASFNSMPLVVNFEERFRFFLSFVNSAVTNYGKYRFKKKAEDFIQEIKAHQTFDTLFKKLFHKKEKSHINSYKAILLVYFIFEHLIKPDDYSRVLGSKGKKYSLDPRYEALIAGLLKPVEGFEFNNPVNFITWNYDLNLLTALRNFVADNIGIIDFINKYQDTKGYFQIGEDVKVFHLNGYVYHNTLNEVKNYNMQELFVIIKKLVEQFEDPDSKLYNDALKISFAWETVPPENPNELPELIELAKGTIQKCEKIVLIGYSLPPYNRIYDSNLINSRTLKSKRFYIQNTIAEDILQIISSDFEVNTKQKYDGDPMIVTQTNCNSFILV